MVRLLREATWIRCRIGNCALVFLSMAPPSSSLRGILRGFLIHVFSLGYMADDEAKARYFGGFPFSCSRCGNHFGGQLDHDFRLLGIGWFQFLLAYRPLLLHRRGGAGFKKAFIVNRIGDFGFLIGIVLTYWAFDTVNLVEIENQLNNILAWNQENPQSQVLTPVTTALCLALACGFIGKSAQFPLHVWLPDAMAGPSPVSALIHAATMVAAGIFLLVRIEFLFH